MTDTNSTHSDYAALFHEVREASHILGVASTEVKNKALQHIAEEVESARGLLRSENTKDLDAARKNNLDAAMLDRLQLGDDIITAIVQSLEEVIALEDPIGRLSKMNQRASGIKVATMRVPLGVIGVIYESRPNVTVDAASLCLKSGNAVVLRGGSEAIRSNCALADCIARGLTAAGLPLGCAQIIRTTDRAAVSAMLAASDDIDIIIPRGGKSLIKKVSAESTIPVIKHLDGICHVYVDGDADIDKALAIAVNAKTHRYGVCNAMETLLVDSKVASQFLPQVAAVLEDKGVELRVCEQSQQLLSNAKAATEEDMRTEYLAPILTIKVVAGIDEAIQHIQHYGSHHTDSIVTENEATSTRFLREVDSSSVMVNASTRFADGFEYGLGAEMGISTDKLHVRGPVGLEGLTTQKYVVFGEGHIRE